MTKLFSLSYVFNQCATCAHWGAERRIKVGWMGKKVEVADAETCGECLNEASLFRHQLPRGSSGCSTWEKWSALEEPRASGNATRADV